MRICVYTCITGSYDKLKDIEYKEKNIDYICFTNNKRLKSNFWKVIYIDNEGLDNVRLARKIKTLGHPYILKNYDVSVWIDGAVNIRSSVVNFIKKYTDIKEYPFTVFKHRYRNCIYDEAKICINMLKDDKEIINNQITKYKKENYPKNNGLIETTVLIKNHNDKIVQKTMNLWFNEILNHSKRDQISLPYVLNKTNLKYKILDLNVFDNECFYVDITSPHNKYGLEYYDTIYQVVFDKGEGAKEENLITNYYDFCDDTFIAKFKIQKGTKRVLFYPVIYQVFAFSDIKIEVNNKQVNYNIVPNYIEINNKKYFTNKIPIIIFEASEGEVVLQIKLEEVNIEELIKNNSYKRKFTIKSLIPNKIKKILRPLKKFIVDIKHKK